MEKNETLYIILDWLRVILNNIFFHDSIHHSSPFIVDSIKSPSCPIYQ